MYITLQSIKRNLGLFNLTIEDLVVFSIFAITFTIFFLTGFVTTSIVIVAFGVISLFPVDFSKSERMYKLLILFIKYISKSKKFYYIGKGE